MKSKIILFIFFAVLTQSALYAQIWTETTEKSKPDLGKNIRYEAELQTTVSKGKTPLWLNANKYGLSSLEETNGYLRGAVMRPLQTDSARRWAFGYGLDAAVTYGFTSRVVVQQAFAEIRWLHGVLSVGSKNYPMELKNNELSSGSQALGINARPVPQVRLALLEYWTLPFGNGWLKLKGHIAYGKMTDDKWQHSFTGQKTKYADDVLYHSKAGYLKIGNEERFVPLSLELGLEMASIFGGTAYRPLHGGTMETLKGRTGLKAFWKAFIPGGGDVGETTYQNAEGDQLGAWLGRVNYDADTWRLSFYADKFFEDHSALFQLDYDGYGSGSEWQKKVKRRYLLYDFKDWLLGAEFNFKYNRWITGVVFEYIYTRYQSGPVYHDHTSTIPDHIGGNDDFYNHYIYPGWQHWGQVMGNPLYRSPIYNTDGTVTVKNNRFVGYHLGINGNPSEALSYKFLATYQRGWGTYSDPYTKSHHNVSLLLEANYRLKNNWAIKGGYGMDFGGILGNCQGFQLTISKKGIFKK